MKITFYITLFLLMVAAAAHGQNRSIRFNEGRFSEILSEAKAKKMPVFVDAYTSWCGPCKMMASKVFTNDSVADYFNTHFVSTKIDMEKGEGVELAKKYEVKAYPTFLIIDGDGKLVHKVVGYQSPSEFIEKISVAFNPSKTLSGMALSFKNGSRDAEMVSAYVEMLRKDDKDEEAWEVVQQFVKDAPSASLFTRKGWELLKVSPENTNNPIFDFVLAHQKEYSRVVGDTSVVKFIVYRTEMEALRLLKNVEKEKIDLLRAKIAKIGCTKNEIALGILDLAELKGDGKVDRLVAKMESMWTASSLYSNRKFLIIRFVSPLVIERGNEDELRKMITMTDSFLSTCHKESTKSMFENTLKQPLVGKLNEIKGKHF